MQAADPQERCRERTVDANGLMTAALGLREPWQTTNIELDTEKRQVDIIVDFPRGSTLSACASATHDMPRARCQDR